LVDPVPSALLALPAAALVKLAVAATPTGKLPLGAVNVTALPGAPTAGETTRPVPLPLPVTLKEALAVCAPSVALIVVLPEESVVGTTMVALKLPLPSLTADMPEVGVT
jgi:hypothetical protein